MVIVPESYINLIRLNGPGIYYEDVGGIYVGTIIGYIHGMKRKYLLIAAPENIGESRLSWCDDINDRSIHQTFKKLQFHDWDGTHNTRIIPIDTSPLKRWCSNLDIGNFTDWYIPAINELGLVQKFLELDEPHWSSTNYAEKYAWSHYRIESIGIKSAIYSTRAVRRVILP